MGQNEPQVFIQCLILADYTYKFISLQCLGPFYSYDAFTLMGLLGYRSYIYPSSSDYCSPHFARYFLQLAPYGNFRIFSGNNVQEM